MKYFQTSSSEVGGRYQTQNMSHVFSTTRTLCSKYTALFMVSTFLVLFTLMKLRDSGEGSAVDWPI